MEPAELTKLPISIINLDIDNPRIKQCLEHYKEVNSEILALALSDNGNNDTSTTYHSLKESIKVSRGIIHPIIVNLDKEGKYIVIEGNTRLQIYKEFAENEPDGPWNEINCLVYKHLSDIEKHEIRLQSHLVGPREWDPYSKAKYLYQLSEEEHLPMNQIIDLCGGGKSEIQKSIDAYIDMERYYRSYSNQKGYIFNPREYSKFREYQNGTIKNIIFHKGYEPHQFAEWVADGNIDHAQKVRILPKVLKDEEATYGFKKKNLTEAEKILNAKELVDADLTKYPYETLCKALYQKLQKIELMEIQSLATNEKFDDRKQSLEQLQGQLNFVINNIKDRE